jgi:hypothetical protein
MRTYGASQAKSEGEKPPVHSHTARLDSLAYSVQAILVRGLLDMRKLIVVFLGLFFFQFFGVDAYCVPPPNSANPQTPIENRTPAEVTDDKNYFIPAVEIVGFEFLLNQYNRHYLSDNEDYESNINTIQDNFHRGFGFDRDSFHVNQIGHPYQGSIYYGISRSSGLNFWESLAYTTAGSTIWEYAGETTRPSTNDEVTTSLGGTFLGEGLFRVAEVFFAKAERTNDTAPEVGAAVASPPGDFNRLVFGNELKPESPRRRPPVLAEFQLGLLHDTNIKDSSEVNDTQRNSAMFNFKMEYGMPGDPNYRYERPFDYFNLEGGFAARSDEPVDHIDVRGLLYGKKYKGSENSSGVFGLYGSYDYLAPEVFRVASTALSLGSTNRWKLSRDFVLQTSALAGAGFGAGGSSVATDEGSDYHYGAVPQGLIDLKLMKSDRMSLQFSAADFLLTGKNSDPNETGNENITQLKTALNIRVSGPNALSLQYIVSRRDVEYSNRSDRHPGVDTLGIYYSYLWGKNI